MKKLFSDTGTKITVIGGGTGSFTLLKELKRHTRNIAALVSMADDGGSTGVLRDELGALPPGDVRQCLVALSSSSKLRDLFSYRFEAGTFEGHSFGNLLLTALEKTTGDFAKAVETASEILDIRGVVLPITLDDVRLRMTWDNASVVLRGERVIDAESFAHDPRQATLSLEPNAAVNPHAVDAILDADMVVIAPGDLYTSIGPALAVDGVVDALAKTSAKVVYVCNLVTKHGQTDGFTVQDHVGEIERFMRGLKLDGVFYNTTLPNSTTLERYHEEQADIVRWNEQMPSSDITVRPGDYLGAVATRSPHDVLPVVHSYIRHDSTKICRALMEYAREDV